MAHVREKPIRWLWWLPNSITFTSMGFIYISCIAALKGGFAWVLFAIMGWVVFDFLDGFAARATGNISPKGGDLDSFNDFFGSFGSSFALWAWALKDGPWYLYPAAFLYPIAAAYRLAKFNVMDRDPEKKKGSDHFIGLPTPAATGFILMPLIYSFDHGDTFRSPYIVASLMALVSLLMISNIPTISNKQVSMKYYGALAAATGLCMVAGGVWYGLLCIGGWYAASILVYNVALKWRAIVRQMRIVSSKNRSDLSSQERSS